MDEHLSVRRRPEPMTLEQKMSGKLAVVVNLTIKDYPNGAIFIAHRLVTCFQIYDGQTAHAEPYVGADVEAGIIWAAMNHWGADHAQLFERHRLPSHAQYSSDATH